ncbi:sodium:proton exchanger [Candidatus Woesearchaeota archaeon]|nr:MAG: sodium:proton exchanger [Candidatus Woesearchaeota archaeon]
MSGSELFIEISVVLISAWFMATLLRLFRQPVIIGYILTGVIVGPLLGVVTSSDTLAIFSKLGVAFLLFIVGINLNLRLIRDIGVVSLIVGFVQVVLTALLGTGICLLLGFSLVPSLYVGLGLAFSSTIIVLKLLSDKHDLETLHGRLATGVLLVQDLVVIVVLVAFGTLTEQGAVADVAAKTLFKILGLGMLFLIAHKTFPKVERFIARSQEYLFVFSIGWCFAMAALVQYLGFSLEIGALLAGVVLSVSPFHYEISAKVKTLRDFFLILFFVFLGSEMVFSNVSSYVLPALVLSAFVLLVKPLIIIILLGLLGYSKKTSFLTAISLAQISEFSLIILSIGVGFGHVPADLLSLTTLVGIITIAGSAYFIKFGTSAFPFLARFLALFERKRKTREHHGMKKFESYEVVMFGYNRIGFDLLNALKRAGARYLLVDYNPDTIVALTKESIECKYGDATDPELLNQLNLGRAKMVISTIPDPDTNLLIINKVHAEGGSAIIIVVAHQIEDALKLYDEGATYVLMPHFLGGKHIATMIENYQFDVSKFLREQVQHVEHLRVRKKLGHQHPPAEKHR